MVRTLGIGALILFVAFPLLDCGQAEEGGGGGGEWQPLVPLQIARQETGAARLGDSVYVFGGLLAGTPLRATASVEIYSLTSGGWTFGEPLPVPLDHMAAAAADGHLFVMGGYSGDFQARADVWINDPAQPQWTPGAPIPEPRGAAWAVEHGGKIYLFGGTNAAGAVTRTTFIYDPAQNQWSSGADMPTRREHLNAVAAGPYIYVIGGRNGPSTGANERFDPANNQWASLAPMPTPRSAMVLGVIGSFIYAAGGEVPMLFAINEVYSIAGVGWGTATPMTVPRHGVAAVSLESAIFAPGGGTVQGLHPTDYVDRFVAEVPGGVVEGGAPPTALTFLQFLPNPFPRSTVIQFSLGAPEGVLLTIHDAQGRHVRELIAAGLTSGMYAVRWDGRDDTGRSVPAGVYFVQLAIRVTNVSRKLVLAR